MIPEVYPKEFSPLPHEPPDTLSKIRTAALNNKGHWIAFAWTQLDDWPTTPRLRRRYRRQVRHELTSRHGFKFDVHYDDRRLFVYWDGVSTC